MNAPPIRKSAVAFMAKDPKGRLRFFKRCKSLARRAFVLCRQFPARWGNPGSDDQLALPSAPSMDMKGVEERNRRGRVRWLSQLCRFLTLIGGDTMEKKMRCCVLLLGGIFLPEPRSRWRLYSPQRGSPDSPLECPVGFEVNQYCGLR